MPCRDPSLKNFKVIYFKADKNIIIPQAHKRIHIEIRVHFTKLWAFKDVTRAHFSKPSQTNADNNKIIP